MISEIFLSYKEREREREIKKYFTQNPCILLGKQHIESNVKATKLWFSAKCRKVSLNIKTFIESSPIIQVDVSESYFSAKGGKISLSADRELPVKSIMQNKKKFDCEIMKDFLSYASQPWKWHHALQIRMDIKK